MEARVAAVRAVARVEAARVVARGVVRAEAATAAASGLRPGGLFHGEDAKSKAAPLEGGEIVLHDRVPLAWHCGACAVVGSAGTLPLWLTEHAESGVAPFAACPEASSGCCGRSCCPAAMAAASSAVATLGAQRTPTAAGRDPTFAAPHANATRAKAAARMAAAKTAVLYVSNYL